MKPFEIDADVTRASIPPSQVYHDAAVYALHRGVRSGLYDRGRYSSRRETGTHYFHRLLARALVEPA